MLMKHEHKAWPLGIGILFLVFFSVAFWMKVTDPHWTAVGDTLNAIAIYAFQLSGFFRGEYYLWDPLIRCGQNETTMQMLFFANPVTNMVNAGAFLAHSHDMVAVYAASIYVMIALYAGGLALLATTLTKNLNAGIFVFIVALSSSTVLTSAEEFSFIFILFALPLMIYGLINYFSGFQFRYLLLFFLAFCVFLYSYEVPLGLVFLFVLSLATLMVYRKEIPAFLGRAQKMPLTHRMAACVLFLIFSFPMLSMFKEYKTDLLPISRLTHITLTGHYELRYGTDFFKNHFSPLTSKKFWPAVLTGFTCDNYILLRHYLIPVAAPFLIMAVINFSQIGLVLLLTAIGVSLFSGNLFPANLLLKFPVFNSIHNLHFLVQYVLMVFILMAGLGFDILSKQWSPAARKKMNIIIIALLSFYFLLAFIVHLFPGYEKQNEFAVGSSIVAGFLLLAAINYIPDRKREVAVLVLAMLTAIAAVVMMNKYVPIIGGWQTQNKDLLSLRHRTDHSLKFLYERPDTVQTSGLDHWDVDLGLAEDYSYLSLKDNAYEQGNYRSGMSGWPYLKNTYLFLMLPGHGVLAKKKFLFFDRMVNANDPQEMMAFKRDPDLFKQMTDKGIGMVSGYHAPQDDFFRGDFKPQTMG